VPPTGFRPAETTGLRVAGRDRVRFNPTELLDPHGKVIAREGQVLGVGGGKGSVTHGGEMLSVEGHPKCGGRLDVDVAWSPGGRSLADL
jgi:hypothetical protein